MNWDTVSFRLLRSLRRLSMSVDALLASVDAAFERPSLPRFSASLTSSRAVPKSDEREPALADAPCVDAFTISSERPCRGYWWVNERPNGHPDNRASTGKFHAELMTRQSIAAS